MKKNVMIVAILAFAAVFSGTVQAVVQFYEPFDYTAGELLHNVSDWTLVSYSSTVQTPGLSYGTLPVSGGHMYGKGNYTLNSVAADLASAGLLADGQTLWMSAVTQPLVGSNANLVVRLGTDYVDGNNSISGTGGESLGFNYQNGSDLQKRYHIGGTMVNTKIRDNLTLGENVLLVIEMKWNADPDQPDTINYYLPDADLNMGSVVSKIDTVAFDQAVFDTFSVARSSTNSTLLDEIRFGVSYDDVIGVDPFLPNPADGTTVDAANPLTLSWTNIYASEPNVVTYDVWFGTDPGTPGETTWKKYVAGEDATSLDVDASVPTTYYWQIDVTIGDANTIEGGLYSFTTTNDPAPTVEILTPAMMTYSNNPVALDATVTDEGPSLLTYGWTASPDGAGDPNLIVDFVATDEDPVVTVTNLTGSMVTITMTLTAFDEANSAPEDISEASIEIDVYPDACAMAKNGENIPVAKTDFNADCITNIVDLAEMAAAWLVDYKSTAALPR